MSLSERKKIGGLALAAFTVLYYGTVVLLLMKVIPPLVFPWFLIFHFCAVVVWFIPSAALIWWIGQGK
jgi:uncharacterized membrane protein